MHIGSSRGYRIPVNHIPRNIITVGWTVIKFSITFRSQTVFPRNFRWRYYWQFPPMLSRCPSSSKYVYRWVRSVMPGHFISTFRLGVWEFADSTFGMTFLEAEREREREREEARREEPLHNYIRAFPARLCNPVKLPLTDCSAVVAITLTSFMRMVCPPRLLMLIFHLSAYIWINLNRRAQFRARCRDAVLSFVRLFLNYYLCPRADNRSESWRN